MVFSRYKEWMGEINNKLGHVHLAGVREFVKYAKRNLNQKNLGSDLISCPCARCRNGKQFKGEDVELHLLKSGMQQDYVFWKYHGEREFPYIPELTSVNEPVPLDSSNDLNPGVYATQEGNEPIRHNSFTDLNPSVSGAQEGDDPLRRSNLNDLIHDSYGVHPNEGPEVEDLSQEKEYIKLKAAASRPLYPNCNPEHTTLYATVGLHNLKSRFGLSGNSVTEILKWAKDLLPKENTLPETYPEMKCSLKGLGMKYKSIHVCWFDCVLYTKEHKNKSKCPVRKEPRYVQKATLNSKHKVDTQVPRKVLRYFPLGPRLRRLYTVPWIAEAMTWHARAEVCENLMRHPIDSSMWKSTNQRYPEFAQESRNIRLGIATDGFNPFGNLSSNTSLWPVFVFPYNLPPSLCMKKEFSILSMLIPGPKAPSDDIDIFLAPLVEELQELWFEGVAAFHSFKQETFTLRAMVLWAIHDFPAYGTLSGCNVHGYLGCPICGEETEASWLTECHKVFYHSHRRFLPPDHKFRLDKSNFLLEGTERRRAPKRLSGMEVEAKSTLVFQALRGKHPKILKEKRKLKEEGMKGAWSRRSIMFDLPYWKEHQVRHVLDIMHAEKNIIEHIVGTCLDGSQSKDGVNARKDLRQWKMKRSLWLKEDPNTGKTIMPDGAFLLSNTERKALLDTLYELKLPSNFSSNLRRIVNYGAHDLKQCKSHDWHVIMQLVPLLFGHCFSKHKDLRRAIMQISLCFTLICAKVVNRKHILAAKVAMVEATCVLEKYFPPSFFDISIHLVVHLCDEALQCGPVRYRWMYPIERLMKIFKDYVKNTRYVEGSIAEEYITEEASIYAKEYIPKPSTRECFVDESEGFADEEALGNGKSVTLTSIQYEQVTRYLFDTDEAIDYWKGKYNTSEQGRKRKRAGYIDNEFRIWVSKELLKIGDVSSRLARLAKGPNFVAKEYGKYRLNGFLFSSSAREEKLVSKQNSGISFKALTSFRASAKDKNLVEAEITYYGIIRQILELDYISFKEIAFYCDWVKVEDKAACMVDPDTKTVMVDLNKMKSKDHINDEPFVCSFQNPNQVFYGKSPKIGPWYVVLYSPRRLTTSVNNLKAPTHFQSALDDNPELKSFLDLLDD